MTAWRGSSGALMRHRQHAASEVQERSKPQVRQLAAELGLALPRTLRRAACAWRSRGIRHLAAGGGCTHVQLSQLRQQQR